MKPVWYVRETIWSLSPPMCTPIIGWFGCLLFVVLAMSIWGPNWPTFPFNPLCIQSHVIVATLSTDNLGMGEDTRDVACCGGTTNHEPWRRMSLYSANLKQPNLAIFWYFPRTLSPVFITHVTYKIMTTERRREGHQRLICTMSLKSMDSSVIFTVRCPEDANRKHAGQLYL